MIYQIIISTLLAILFLNFALNMNNLRRPRHNTVLKCTPKVSVIVPARNEAANISSCVESLLQQDYPDFEIIVIDDNSEDNTAAIVHDISRRDTNVRLIMGAPLPLGWAGKPFACFQAAKQACGEWLLFTDADTTHSPQMLRKAMALAQENHVSLLSGFPRHRTDHISQKIATPMIYFLIMSLIPLWLLHSSSKPLPSLAIGQFLLFSADAYWKIGGHEAVKNRVTEDIYLGIAIAKAKGRHLAVDLSSLVNCHMYSNIAESWRGLSRALYGISALSYAALGMLLFLGCFVLLAPLFWLVALFFMTDMLPQWGPLVIMQVALLLIMRRWADAHFKEDWTATLLYPLGIIFLIAVVANGMWRRLIGASISWKKRSYHSNSKQDDPV
ncbi:MAG: glycosyltransferase [Dehalococcoidia bacterium]|nr:glycosyltransferase [Dehalococcoidia bacterium]